MKPDKIKALLQALNAKKRGERPGWILGSCPFAWKHGGEAGHGEFAISNDPKKKSRYKCLSCGEHGDLTDLLLDIQFALRTHPELRPKYNLLLASAMVSAEFEEMELSAADIPDFESPVEKDEHIFPEQWLESFKRIQLFPQAMNYCLGRGLSEEVLKDLEVRYDPHQKRVCFPFRNFKGELMGLQGRYIGDEQTKDKSHEDGILRYYHYGWHGHRNMHIWLGEEKLNLDMPVVAVEGPFDYAKVFMVYPNVAASFTSGLSMTKLKRLGDADTLITFYDHGHGGDSARESFEKYLKKVPMVHIIPPEEDGDAGAMDPADIREALREFLEFAL
jgi:hypothetical protein